MKVLDNYRKLPCNYNQVVKNYHWTGFSATRKFVRFFKAKTLPYIKLYWHFVKSIKRITIIITRIYVGTLSNVPTLLAKTMIPLSDVINTQVLYC